MSGFWLSTVMMLAQRGQGSLPRRLRLYVAAVRPWNRASRASRWGEGLNQPVLTSHPERAPVNPQVDVVSFPYKFLP